MVTNSVSTSFGRPSGSALPRAVMMMGPRSPELSSAAWFTSDWYSHSFELTPSRAPGPACRNFGKITLITFQKLAVCDMVILTPKM